MNNIKEAGVLQRNNELYTGGTVVLSLFKGGFVTLCEWILKGVYSGGGSDVLVL